MYLATVALLIQAAQPPLGAEEIGIHPLLSPIEGWLIANPVWGGLTIAAIVVVCGELLHRSVRRYVLRFLEHVARHSPTDWDNAMFEAQMPQRLTWGVPLIVWYHGVLIVPGVSGGVTTILQRLLLATMVVVPRAGVRCGS